MNYLLKNAKYHQKTSSDISSKSKKKQISSSRMIIKQNLINLQGKISSSIKKNYFPKGKKILGIKNFIKSNNINENISNKRDSNKKNILNDKCKNDESKGDIDIYDDNSTNNLTSTALNNESSINNTNVYFKRTLLSSSKNINNNIDINSENIKISNYNTNTNNYRKKNIYNKKNSLEFLSVCKSKSNKEIKNSNNNNFNNINNSIKRNDITQRCRHKQVKREIYINNMNKNNKDNNLNPVRKIKNKILNFDDISPENEKYNNKLIIDNKENNKNISFPLTKINKNNYCNNIKKQQTLLELYDCKNKLNKKTKNSFINDESNINSKENKDSNNNSNNTNNNNNNKYFEKKNIKYLNNTTINRKIKRIKSPYLISNNTNSENNINNTNSNCINNIEISKTTNKIFKSNDNINKFKRINSIHIEPNNLNNNNTFIYNDFNNINNNINNNILDNINKKQYKKNKNQNIIKNYNFMYNNTDKKKKDYDICFDENELDENTLSVSNGKYIENKKCQIIINKVFHFETGSNEIFNNFRTKKNINSINKMSFLNKNQSTKSMNNKKNSCNTIINSNYNNNSNCKKSNNNVNIKNINIIIRNNLDYNLNKKKKIKNDNLLKKCYTDVFIENNNNKNDISKNDNYELIYYKNGNNDNIKNQEYNSSESSTTSFKIDNIINNSKNSMMYKKIRYLNYNNKRYFFKIFQCHKFKKILFSFCDINLLNKICLLSRQVYKFMKPFIYNKINNKIYNPNINKNLKIKKYLMEKFSPLSKFSQALIKKKYTDLKFENNHKNDIEIKKDLTRTFPDNILFKYGNHYYNKLYHVLTAYSNYNKNIGYAQGLNFLAANIIYFFEEEIEEFIFLDALIHKFDLDKILCTSNSNHFIKKLTDINNFIIHKLPKLSKYLSDIKLNYEYFTTNWVLTLFSNSMETQYLFYIWDYMIIFGWKFFKCFVVSVLMNFENDILNATQNNITFIMKNMLKNNKFNTDFQTIILRTVQMLIKEK